MCDSKLVSIVIPTYNRAHLIGETLDSIIVQTYQNWECIVVDDGSTDYTKELMEFYCQNDSRIQYHNRPAHKPKGANACRNYGFKLSKGQYINWFDSDDVMLENYIGRQIICITEKYDMSVCKAFKKDGSKGMRTSKIETENLIEDYILNRVTFYSFCVLWNRKFLNLNNALFDESLNALQDWDFNLRMIYEKPRINYINEALIIYRIHSSSITGNLETLDFLKIKSEFLARKKHLSLLKKNKAINHGILQEFIIHRNKILLRSALERKSDLDSFLFGSLCLKQINSLKVFGAFKTVLGFLSYKIFNKGYRFFS